MRLVQVILTDDQAILLHGAAAHAAESAEDVGATAEETLELQRLSMFFAEVGQNPAAFPVATMASSVKSQLRRLKGEAQPPSRQNKRKARQERRQGGAKLRRARRKELAANFNRVRAELEAYVDTGAFVADLEARPSSIVLPPGVES